MSFAYVWMYVYFEIVLVYHIYICIYKYVDDVNHQHYITNKTKVREIEPHIIWIYSIKSYLYPMTIVCLTSWGVFKSGILVFIYKVSHAKSLNQKWIAITTQQFIPSSVQTKPTSRGRVETQQWSIHYITHKLHVKDYT